MQDSYGEELKAGDEVIYLGLHVIITSIDVDAKGVETLTFKRLKGGKPWHKFSREIYKVKR